MIRFVFTTIAITVTFLGHLSPMDHRCSAQVAKSGDEPVLMETFDQAGTSPPADWNVVEGYWRVEDGLLVADSLDGESYITFGEPSWQNYEVEATVTFREVRNEARWVSILVRATPNGETPWSQAVVRFDSTKPNGMEFAVKTSAKQWSVRSKGSTAAKRKLNQPQRLKIAVRGSRVDIFLDGQQVVNSQLCVDRATGCVGLGVSGCVAAFDDVAVRQLPPSENKPADSSRRADVVAHRGFSAIAPENTLAAIRAAIKAGATGCEFDVYACADGTIVLMHDKTVERTTNSTGQVTDLMLQQLRKLDAGSWKDPKYAGEPVPTLTEALKLLKGTGCQPVIEIKMEGIAKQVVSDVRALEMVDQVAIIAFSADVVREVRELEPRIVCAWLSSKELSGSVTEQADWLQKQARACHAKLLDLRFTMLSPELVTELKKRGLGVWTWTVNESAVMQALQQWGVDSITTDRPNLLNQSADF
ncbi:glycerophosphodiester phosphodiesterase family protein [Fuerstiella marisgermanici]|uniref:Glycerophosphoryl diester phosphodiesterase n=1 Tax=Fuerstiella marisgermanici TaxID=1891926 RepID=A0A1P8WL48_9PLAN|nr:glycerophosphodiester phosphodiesterase family protein [Fuerstiella marisgermanici]APZ94761.1 Glycerophosphoryl diester phosphodiesterase [Fuerstiella marisgermanici]